MSSPIIKKYPTEIFGFPFIDISQSTQNHRKKQICPFLDDECKKPRKSNPEIKVGDCSVGYKGEFLTKFEPVIICPYRFNADSVFKEIEAQNFKGKWVPEVSIGSAGSIDYVLTKVKSNGDIEDFICVEFQAAGTTGTPWVAIRELEKNGKFSKDSYDYGINWANEFLKTMMQQAYKKGIILESWGKKIIFVIQNVALEYLKSACNTSGLREANDNDSIHFYTFKMEWNGSKWDLMFDKKLSTDAEGIRKMLSGSMSENHPKMEEFIKNIKRKMR
jgi:hypothetical protein